MNAESWKQKNNVEYLREGEQTIITEQIRKMAETIEGGFEEKIKQIFDQIGTLAQQPEKKDEVFRKRTADQILSDGYVTESADEVLVFIALARAAGIPSKYIETIDMNWMKTGEGPVQGHVYAGTFDEGKCRVVDPSQRSIDVDIKKDGRVIYQMGLDSWGIGISDAESLAHNIGTFREIATFTAK